MSNGGRLRARPGGTRQVHGVVDDPHAARAARCRQRGARGPRAARGAGPCLQCCSARPHRVHDWTLLGSRSGGMSVSATHRHRIPAADYVNRHAFRSTVWVNSHGAGRANIGPRSAGTILAEVWSTFAPASAKICGPHRPTSARPSPNVGQLWPQHRRCLTNVDPNRPNSGPPQSDVRSSLCWRQNLAETRFGRTSRSQADSGSDFASAGSVSTEGAPIWWNLGQVKGNTR